MLGRPAVDLTFTFGTAGRLEQRIHGHAARPLRGGGPLALGFGRIIASEKEVLNMLAGML